MKNLKNFFLYLVLSLISTTVWYLLASFIKFDFNPINWEEPLRFLVVAGSLITLIGIYLIYSIDNHIDK